MRHAVVIVVDSPHYNVIFTVSLSSFSDRVAGDQHVTYSAVGRALPC